VERAHRVVVALVNLHLEDGMARFDGLQDKAQQSANRRRGHFTPQQLLSKFEDRRHGALPPNRAPLAAVPPTF
jgi:hypothetical protein